MLSIVIPVYNAKDFLEQTLSSVFATTKTPFELILIDDFSDQETFDYIESIDTPGIKLTTIHNAEHKWTNYCWNLGALISEGDYIAILNSDIILSDGWDLPLIKALDGGAAVACPVTRKKNEEKEFLQELDPLMLETNPDMINGSAYMFKKKDKGKIFPIPEDYKHWCGDNYIADRIKFLGGVKFCIDSVIKHFVSRSSATIPIEKLKSRILQDMDAYERQSGNKLSPIKKRIFGHD